MRWVREHPALSITAAVVAAAGVVATALFGRGLLFWMLWAGGAIGLVLALALSGGEEPPPDSLR